MPCPRWRGPPSKRPGHTRKGESGMGNKKDGEQRIRTTPSRPPQGKGLRGSVPSAEAANEALLEGIVVIGIVDVRPRRVLGVAIEHAHVTSLFEVVVPVAPIIGQESR